MPLVSSKPVLEEALRRHFAVGAFNANNMEQVQAIVEVAQEERAPVILQVSQGAIRYAGMEFAAGLVKIAAGLASVPVVLHLDHGTDFEQNVLCLRAGFTSLMYDGSKRPFEENVATTRRVA
ncbi:MAG: class II fructose-bisphosphate aldolase, partial [Anaerolineae bacterium]|nr:class II fructose-bisphosphate aldolase [Anaerolineae bacterium]